MAWKPLEAEPQLPALDGATLIDSHCHLDMDFDTDREAVLDRARRNGIAHMVTIGASGRFDANHTAVELAAQHDMLSATVGVHPHEAASVTDDSIAQLAALAARPKVVSIGETGLDYQS
jgi:TatD DNase family protein